MGDDPAEGAVLINDGYSAYARYAAHTGIVHAQCWAHTRRTFERAKDIEPEAVAEALTRIGALYACEQAIRGETPQASIVLGQQVSLEGRRSVTGYRSSR